MEFDLSVFGPRRDDMFIGFDDPKPTENQTPENSLPPVNPKIEQEKPPKKRRSSIGIPHVEKTISKNLLSYPDDSATSGENTVKIPESLISPEEIAKLVEFYKKNGYVVIPNVLTQQQVAECRKGFHDDLLELGVDHNNLEKSKYRVAEIQTHTSGGMPFYYSPWRLRNCAFNLKVLEVTKAIWKDTWGISAAGYHCPFAPFKVDKAFSFIDSMNFRLPSSMVDNSIQKTIGPHIDINPWDHWGGRKNQIRWRPLQGFISLTDSTGGFQCVPGFHLRIKDYFSSFPCPPDYQKGYIGLHGREHREGIHKKMIPVEYKPGDAVLWDWRTAHRISESHPGSDSREVVYTSFLPDIPLNREYVKKQRESFMRGVTPPDFCRDAVMRNQTVVGWREEFYDQLTEIERGLIGENI